MARINQESALIELEKWYNFKRIKPSKRETKVVKIKDKDVIQLKNEITITSPMPVIVEAIMEGDLVLQEDFSFKHKLNFPIGNTKELVYKPRLKSGDIARKLNGIDATNATVLINTYAALLADENTGVIAGLDTEDNRVAQSVAMYFL